MDMLINVDPAMAEDEMAFSYEHENGRCIAFHFSGAEGARKAAEVAAAFFVAELTGCFSDAETLGEALADHVEVVS